MMDLVKKLVNHYCSLGYPTAYIFNKNGREAGQSIPHWHEHVVFTATRTQEWLGKLTVLKNMLLGGSSPIPQQELQGRVAALQTELSRVL